MKILINNKEKVLKNKFNKPDMNHHLIHLIYLKDSHLNHKCFNNIKIK